MLRAMPRGAYDNGGNTVKYLMLIYGNQEKWASIPADQWPEALSLIHI